MRRQRGDEWEGKARLVETNEATIAETSTRTNMGRRPGRGIGGRVDKGKISGGEEGK